MESTATQLDLFQQDTLANLTVLPGSDKARMMTALSGQRLSAYWKRYDPVGLLVKMLLDTSQWASMTCFLTWTTSGTPRNRLYFQLQPSEPHTEETGYLYLPTPTASMWKGACKNRYKGSKHYRGSFTQEALRTGPNDPLYINPNYVEVLMGFPDNWTDLNH